MHRKQLVLIWLPVALLPIANLVSAAVTHTAPKSTIQILVFAVLEELLYRWLLLDKLLLQQERIKPTVSIVIAALIFAAMHLWNLRTSAVVSSILMQVVFAFCFSVWAGAVTWKKTWLIPLLAHVLLNATAGAENMWGSVIVSIMLLVDGIALLTILRRF